MENEKRELSARLSEKKAEQESRIAEIRDAMGKALQSSPYEQYAIDSSVRYIEKIKETVRREVKKIVPPELRDKWVYEIVDIDSAEVDGKVTTTVNGHFCLRSEMDMSTNDYKICHECGSKMYRKSMSKKFLYAGKEIEINNCNGYVCENCGEIVYSAEDIKVIEKIITSLSGNAETK